MFALKNVISLNFANFSILANVFFWVECNVQLHGCVPIEGGWNTGVGRSSSIKPNSGIFIDNLRAGRKIQTKNESGELILMGKGAQLPISNDIKKYL